MTETSFKTIIKTSEERLGKDQSYLLDSSAMREQHGWCDEIKLNEGLQETLAWVKNNISLLKTLPWNYKHKT